MKKPFIRLILFMVLMLVLTAGLTYMSLNHVSETKDKEDSKKMDVALVNEDEGTTFNKEELDFGERFVKSLDKNNEQDWYVVSRGVAENGLERGTYDMMIVIPNDFSDRALSMTDDHPEQVVLDYKINASDNDKVQAQAEDTASSILNDFNRRVIDVYFASVIGNLHDAQDNITELVEEEAEHTSTYNTSVNNTLSEYTDQFETVKDSSAASKDSFESFEDILDTFQEGLIDKVDSSEEYKSSVADAEKLNEALDELGVDFMDELNNYYNSMGEEDVDDQLQSLMAANDYINSQFSEDDEDSDLSSVAADTKALKKRLSQALQSVDEAHNELENAIEKGLIDKEVEDELRGIVEEAFDDQDDLSELLSKQDDDVREKMNDQISKLPTLDEESIEDSDLSPETKQEIKNVIKVTNKYDKEFDRVQIDEQDILSDHVSALIEELKENGVEVTDTAEVPENKKSEQVFELHEIPEAFEIEHLTLTMPGKEKIDFSGSEAEETITLPSNEEGEFEVELTLKLKEEYDETLDSFDVYSEFTEWYWTLEQEDTNNEFDDEEDDDSTAYQPTKSQLVASTTTENDDKDSKTKTSENDDTDQSDDKDKDEKSDNESKGDSKKDSNDDKGDSDESDKDSSDKSSKKSDEDTKKKSDEKSDKKSKKETKSKSKKDSDSNVEDDEEEPEIEEVEVYNNYFKHQVTKPVIDESTLSLINAVENTISPYQKLLSTYETYFGFDLACEGKMSCAEIEIGDDDSLKDMATDESLYHLFNETSVKDLLADYILKKIEGDVKEAVNGPIDSLNSDIEDYRDFIKETDANAEELVEKITETKVETRNLNDSLEETLDNISDWREKSSSLLDTQTEIQSKSTEENTAVMSLSHEFEPLLSQSQSLVDQSSSNLETADSVYRTFERVDEQAENIRQSGTDLIKEADDLSNDMTNKLEEDEEFVDNFQGVLENSRIGGQQNEDLYDFLSSPVDTENKGLIIKGDTFTPYFLVLIGFIVALFTGYVISTTSKRNMAEGQFEADRSLMGGNLLITGITAGIGILEGLIIGLLSAHYLGISQGSLVMWTGLMILMMLAMLFVASYLLRQLKMIGMFILLGVMSMYLFLTRALGTGFAGSDQLRAYSPLQYLENMLTKAIQGDTNYHVILFSVIIVAVLAALANLLVWHRNQGNLAKDEQDATQTNS